jgi:hypothetical protein
MAAQKPLNDARSSSTRGTGYSTRPRCRRTLPVAARRTARRATATLEACRKQGYQLAWPSSTDLVLFRFRCAIGLRDRTPVQTAIDKAWIPTTFRLDTVALDIATAKEPRAAGRVRVSWMLASSTRRSRTRYYRP